MPKIIPAKYFDKIKRASKFARISALGSSGWEQIHINENCIASSDCICLYFADSFDASLFDSKEAFIPASEVLSCGDIEEMEITATSLKSEDRKISWSSLSEQNFFQNIKNCIDSNKFGSVIKIPKDICTEIQKALTSYKNKASKVKRVAFYADSIYFVEGKKVVKRITVDGMIADLAIFDYDYFKKIFKNIKNPEISFAKSNNVPVMKVANSKEFCMLAGMLSKDTSEAITKEKK